MAYVLARTGVLMNDPRVATMTAAQWQFQYEALRAHDDDLLEVVVESVRSVGIMFRDALIGVLGLDQLVDPETPAEAAARPPGTARPFLPGVFVLGDVKHANKLAAKAAEAASPLAKQVDDEFEAFSANLHARLKAGLGDGLGDFEPVDDDAWTTPEAEAELAALGITDRPPVTDDEPDEPDETIYLGVRPKKLGLGADGEGGFGLGSGDPSSALIPPLTASERKALGMPPAPPGPRIPATARELDAVAPMAPHDHDRDDGPPQAGVVVMDDDGDLGAGAAAVRPARPPARARRR